VATAEGELALRQSHGRLHAVGRGLLTLVRKKTLGAAGGLIVLLLLLMAAAPGLFTNQSPTAQAPLNALKPPSSEHLFGTDNFGRDVYSRVIYGARTSVAIGFGAVILGLTLASLVGMTSGFAGGGVDLLLQRLVDAVMALPGLVLLLSMMSLLGPGVLNTMLVVGLLTAPATSRVVRASLLRARETQYVEAARATGCSGTYIAVRHILPNIAPELIVLASIGLGGAILAESSLSFLGFGVVPPQPSWGYMLGVEGRRFMTTAPWLAIFPGAAISLCVFSFNMFGDALRDLLDPRLRGSR
jgi:peptide/nickel transport system permease protein